MNSVLGIFGGTFDPVHCGHLELARELRAALGLAAVRFIPAGDPPHRAAPVATRGAPTRHGRARRRGTIRASRSMPAKFTARGRSYTVPTLEELRSEDPSRTLALIVGADTFLGLPTWHRWRDVFELAHVVVVPRPGVPLETALPAALADEWTKRLSRETRRRSPPRPRARSSCSRSPRIRSPRPRYARASSGRRGIAAVRGLLPAAVLAYIERNQLYRSRPGCDLTRSRRPPSTLSTTSRRATSPFSTSASSPASSTR